MTTPAPAPGLPALQGPAFPLGVRLLATALVGAVLVWGVRALEALSSTPWDGWTATVLGTALALVVWSLTWMWRSRTGVDTVGIHQSWIRNKRVAWGDITQARLIAIPYLDFLVTPRLVVRPRGGGTVVFHSADPRVLGAWAAYLTSGIAPCAPRT